MSDKRITIWVAMAAAGCLLVCGPGWAQAAEPTRLSVDEIVSQAGTFSGDDEASHTGMQQLIQRVGTDYLGNTASAKELSVGEWRRVVNALNRGLSGGTRTAWIVTLREAFVPETDVLPDHTVIAFTRLMRSLGAPGADAKAVELFERLRSAGPVDWGTCYSITEFWLNSKNQAEGRVWAKRSYDAALKVPGRGASFEEVLITAELYWRAGLSGPGKWHMEFAEAFRSFADSSVVFRARKYRSVHAPSRIGEYHRCLLASKVSGRMLGTPGTRRIVQARLEEKDGHLLVGLTDALAWAYEQSGKSAEWKAYLDGKIASETVAADEKVFWLLARGYAEMVSEGPRDRMVGKPWMTRALAVAESPTTRLYVVEQIATAYASVGRKTESENFLASVEHQFGDLQKQFANVRANALSLCAHNVAWGREMAAQRDTRKLANYRRALIAKRETARRQGDKAEVARCDELLRELE